MTSYIYNFTGAHGAGKTTLAKEVAESMKKELFLSSASDIHRDFGIRGGDDISFDLRLKVQEAIFNQWTLQYAEAEKADGGVFDRTPLDFAAYLLASCPRNLSLKHSSMVGSYVNLCINFAANMDYLFFVHPHGNDLPNRGKDRPSTDNIAYQMLIHTNIYGFIANFGLEPVHVKPGTINQRVQLIHWELDRLFNLKSKQFAKQEANF